MPNPSCFFCCSSKSNLLVSESFESKFMPFQTVLAQCEAVFGVKASKLSNSDEFALFHITGFCNVYGITKAPSEGSGIIKTTHLQNLNSFLRAKTIADKKAFFLSHSKDYVRQYLATQQIAEATLNALEPIMKYCEQQFVLASHAPLYAKKSKRETKEQFIATLKILGNNISKLLLAGMDIKRLIDSKQVTSAALIKILDPVKALTSPDPLNAKALGYESLLTRDGVVSDAMAALNPPPHVLRSSVV